jgi:hypothetical protein
MEVAVDGASGLLSVQCMLLPLSEIKDGLSFNPPPPPLARVLQSKAEAQHDSATQSSHRSALTTAQ